MQEPFPHQGKISTQKQTPNESGKNNHGIYITGEEMFFQTRNQNYDTPPDTSMSGASTGAPPSPSTKMAKGPTRRVGNYSEAAHNYSIVDDFSQSPTAMLPLEVL